MKSMPPRKVWITLLCLFLGIFGTLLVTFGIPVTQQLVAGTYHFESWNKIVPAPASEQSLPEYDPRHFNIDQI